MAMDQQRIKVLCVDDSRRLTDAWTRLFGMQADLEVVGALPSADSLMEAVAARQPDVVLMDLTMGGRDPLDAVAELARIRPDVRVIICSGHSDPALTTRALDAGAWGCISKAQDPGRIMDAIRSVARGDMPNSQPD